MKKTLFFLLAFYSTFSYSSDDTKNLSSVPTRFTLPEMWQKELTLNCNVKNDSSNIVDMSLSPLSDENTRELDIHYSNETENKMNCKQKGQRVKCKWSGKSSYKFKIDLANKFYAPGEEGFSYVADGNIEKGWFRSTKIPVRCVIAMYQYH